MNLAAIDIQEFINRLNYLDGFSASLWEKHGLKRIYLNKINGEKSSAFIEVIDGKMTKVKNYCQVSLDDLIELAAKASPSSVQVQHAQEDDPVVWMGPWKNVPGGGRIRFYRLKSGYESFEVQGVKQQDLDDYLG